jgi:hypothetical protein
MAIYRCQTASQVSFLISWISLPTKIGTPRIKVISQYTFSAFCAELSLYFSSSQWILFTPLVSSNFSFDLLHVNCIQYSNNYSIKNKECISIIFNYHFSFMCLDGNGQFWMISIGTGKTSHADCD